MENAIASIVFIVSIYFLRKLGTYMDRCFSLLILSCLNELACIMIDCLREENHNLLQKVAWAG